MGWFLSQQPASPSHIYPCEGHSSCDWIFSFMEHTITRAYLCLFPTNSLSFPCFPHSLPYDIPDLVRVHPSLGLPHAQAHQEMEGFLLPGLVVLHSLLVLLQDGAYHTPHVLHVAALGLLEDMVLLHDLIERLPLRDHVPDYELRVPVRELSLPEHLQNFHYPVLFQAGLLEAPIVVV